MPSHRHIKCDIKTTATHTHTHHARKQMEMNIRTKGANRIRRRRKKRKINQTTRQRRKKTQKSKNKMEIYPRIRYSFTFMCECVSMCIFNTVCSTLDGWKHYSTYLGTTLRTICCLLFSFFLSLPLSSLPLLYLTHTKHQPIPMCVCVLSWHAEMDAKFNTKIWVHLILESTLHNKNKSERARISSHS